MTHSICKNRKCGIVAPIVASVEKQMPRRRGWWGVGRIGRLVGFCWAISSAFGRNWAVMGYLPGLGFHAADHLQSGGWHREGIWTTASDWCSNRLFTSSGPGCGWSLAQTKMHGNINLVPLYVPAINVCGCVNILMAIERFHFIAGPLDLWPSHRCCNNPTVCGWMACVVIFCISKMNIMVVRFYCSNQCKSCYCWA